MTLREQERLWTIQYGLILLTNLMTHMVHFVLLVSIPLYLRSLGGSNAAAGLSTGLYSLAALLLRPIIGHFLDHRGRLRFMRGGLIPLILGIVLSYFTDSVELQLALRVLEGIGFSIISTTGATIVSDLVPESRFAEGIGYNSMVITLMNAVGPFVGLTIIESLGFEAQFLILIPLSLFPMGVTLFLKETGRKNPISAEGPAAKDGTAAAKRIEWKHLFAIEKGALAASSLMIFSAVSYGGVITFLTAFGMERGIGSMQFFFVIFPCAVIASRFATGRLIDRYGFSPIVIPSLALGFVSLILIFFAGGIAGFSAAAVLYGLGYGTLVPAFMALALRSSPPDRRGAANATFYISMDLGIGGGAVVLGFLSKYWGLSSVFAVSALLMLVSLVLFPIFGTRRR